MGGSNKAVGDSLTNNLLKSNFLALRVGGDGSLH